MVSVPVSVGAVEAACVPAGCEAAAFDVTR